MASKTRTSLLSLAIITLLVFSPVGSTIAYADGGPTPDTPPTETSAGSEEEGVEEATSTPEPTAVDESTSVPTEATSVPEADPTDTGSQESPTEVPALPATEAEAPAPDSNILNEVPENTTVTVLDAGGQSEPLATQDAAAAIAATSDPIWCPAGEDPIPGANGCTQSFTSFDALLTFLSGNASFQGPGTIYVQQGTYNGGESSIDFNSAAYDLSNISNADLTITGGWDTTTNTLDPAGTSDFTVPILIGTDANPWGGSLTLNNLTINKTSGTGLTLYAQDDITVSNVTVTNSVNGGGAELHAGDRVNVNNSRFDRNKTAGAIIRSGGSVSIADTSFSNPADGRRQITGLDVQSGGSVSLFNVLANENREVGANIDATGSVAIVSSFFSGTKSMKGSGANTVFLGYGLQVVSQEDIDLTVVTANDNFLWGAWLKTPGNVNITDSIFNANTTESPGFIDDTGLLIESGGNVLLTNVQADDNRLIGATINAAGDVSINESSFSNNNGVTLSSGGTPTFHGYGLQVITLGSIFLSVVDASNNTLFGAHLEAGEDVNVSSSTFNNQTSGSVTDLTGRGLEIISGANVFITDTVIDNNQTFGGNVQAAGDVFLNTVTATNNAEDGIDVEASCTTVFLIDGNYSNNGGYGLSITGGALDQSGAPVFANNGAGDIFQDPGTCVFPDPGTGGTGTGGTNNGSVQIPVSPTLSYQVVEFTFNGGRTPSIPLTGVGAGSPSFHSFMTSIRAAEAGRYLSLFTGRYAYIYSSSGLQIVSFSPAPQASR